MKNRQTNSYFYSIVIPTLNEEKYVGKLLKCLHAQTFADFEVIVVDGQSDDATQAVVQGYKKKFSSLKLFVSSKRHVSYQRNLGANSAQGKYLIFFDADVTISKTFLYDLYTQLSTHASAVFTTRLKPDSDDVMDEVIEKVFNLAFQLSIVIDKPFIPGLCFIVRRKAFLAVGGFDTKVRHAEDYDLSLKFAKVGYGIRYLNKPVVTMSLRRYRAEGRLSVLRKHAKAALHYWFKGPIVNDIFDYPMGGGWYKKYYKSGKRQQIRQKVETFMQKFVNVFTKVKSKRKLI